MPSGITPPTFVFADLPETSSPSPPLADDGRIVGPGAHEIGLDLRVVGVGDPQAVAAVAAQHVVDTRTDLDWSVQPIREFPFAPTIATPSSRFPSDELPGGRGPDEVPAQLVLGGPAVDEDAVAAVIPGDQVAERRPVEHPARGIVAARRLAADQIPLRLHR